MFDRESFDLLQGVIDGFFLTFDSCLQSAAKIQC